MLVNACARRGLNADEKLDLPHHSNVEKHHESKTKTKLMSKSVQFLGKNKSLNKLFTKLADAGISI